MEDKLKEINNSDKAGVSGGAQKAGLPPGALVFIGKPQNFEPHLEVITYTSEGAQQHEIATVSEAAELAKTEGVAWVTLFGIHKAEIVGEMGKNFGIHALMLEDILDTTQRPTSEVFGNLLFFSLKMLQWSETRRGITFEQVSFVLGPGHVLLFQDRPGDIFDGLRNRIISGKGQLRQRKGDFLVYRMIDTVVDQYFVAAEKIADRIERLEADIMREPREVHMSRLMKMKKQLLQMRRTIIPLRDNVGLLERSQHPLISPETLPYLRDVNDHIKEVIEMLDMYRETVTGLIDLYMSRTSNKMNEVMKVLTVVTSIFIPLSFFTGVYGMNFDNIPELHEKYGYFILWGVMISITIGMLIFFRRKKWL
ncbi:magnesium/cobalt transporter CorA [Sanyastnella coralliicola]|uniref:magnesium/cobalt transporter CorA n=1 Tax=Sanyastnella coralliicola TaxID=3069118 RepID=UPI0027B9168B|nr:magnesium/cobalt transporter CorA [Longitalea sp. SCSIO 12813]